MAQKVDSQQGIDDIKSSIHLKGLALGEHSLQYNSLIRKFSEPHLREGMVGIQQPISIREHAFGACF